MRRYNNKALEKLGNAADHISAARRNLDYGILRTDFRLQIEQLKAVSDHLRKVLQDEGSRGGGW